MAYDISVTMRDRGLRVGYDRT